MLKKSKLFQTIKGKTKIQVALITVFLSLLILTVISLFILAYVKTSKAYLLDAEHSLQAARKNLVQHTEAFLKPCEKVTVANYLIVKEDKDFIHNKELTSNFIHLLKSFDRFVAFGVGSTSGESLTAAKIPHNKKWLQYFKKQQIPPANFYIRKVYAKGKASLEEVNYYYDMAGKLLHTERKEEDIYDARKRPWYSSAKRQKAISWTPAYTFTSGDKGVTARKPIYDNQGKLEAVIFTDVAIKQITDFLSHQRISKHGIPIIFEENGGILSFSQTPKKEQYFLNKTSLPLRKIIELSYASYLREGKSTFKINLNSSSLLASFTPLSDDSSLEWVLGAIAPEDDFIGILAQTNQQIIYLGSAILLLSILIIILFSKLISKPIHSLAEDMGAIQLFNIDTSKVVQSNLYEISLMSNALHSMKIGLKAFSYYVPTDLVRLLIQEGVEARLGGKKKNLTIFFSDIYDYTHITEILPSDQLIQQTSEYLDQISLAITNQKGTIDKFMGDGVMAFWGAPLDLKDHVVYACRAALECQEKIRKLNAQWEKEKKPLFYTRLALNMGETLVGNIGSKTRLNYTVAGDTVNVCSRLESLNKTYRTNIIVSESVFEATKDLFAFRVLDLIAVKGKSKGMLIYELIGSFEEGSPYAPTEKDLALIKLSERAFKLYLAKKWEEAKKIYKEIIELIPEDNIPDIFLQRIKGFEDFPPPDSWDGVTYLTHK